MKTIRSISIAALSVMLLLSSASVRPMEGENLQNEVFGIKGIEQVQVAPKASWIPSAKGLWNGTKAIPAAVGSFVATNAQKAWSAIPTKNGIANFVSAHPVWATVIAVPTAAAAAYGTYRAGKFAVNKVKSAKAHKALVKQIKPQVFSIAQAVTNDKGAVANALNMQTLIAPLQALVTQLPKSAEKAALETFVNFAVAYDLTEGQERQTTAKQAFAKALQEVYAFYKPMSLKKKALITASVIAVPAVGYAYAKGYIAPAANAAADVTVKAGSFVKNHKLATAGVTAATGVTAFGAYKGIKYLKNRTK